MNGSLILLMLLSYVALAATGLSVLWAYPDAQLSRYRNQLWRLRDELHDGIMDDRIESAQAAADALDLLNVLIVHARDISLSNGLAVMYALRGEPSRLAMSEEHLRDEVVMESAGAAAAADPFVSDIVWRAAQAGVHQLRVRSLGAVVYWIASRALRPLHRVLAPRLGVRTVGREMMEHPQLVSGDVRPSTSEALPAC